MEDAVVLAADQDKVVQAGGTAVGPGDDVVGVAHPGGTGAAGERAVPVPSDDGPPQGGSDESRSTSDVENLAVGAEADRDQVGIAGQPTHGGDREPQPGVCECLGSRSHVG